MNLYKSTRNNILFNEQPKETEKPRKKGECTPLYFSTELNGEDTRQKNSRGVNNVNNQSNTGLAYKKSIVRFR